MNLSELNVSRYHEALRAGKITTEKLVAYYLERIDQYDKKGPKLNAIISVNDKALEEARAIDEMFRKGGMTGKLHGVPVILKDNVDTSDMITTGGSLSLSGNRPEHDAPIVEKLKKEGAIIIAKSNLHEFAIWGETISSILGQTLNPYDLTRTPGGSSGGTGSAIAADFGIIGIGTDTINSGRSPASANTLVGLRPTIGLIDKKGVIPYSKTQDALGPITRTIEDAALALEVLTDSKEIYTDYHDKKDLSSFNIGILCHFFGKAKEHEETNKAVKDMIELMGKNGAKVIQIDDQIDSDYLVNEVSVHLYDLKDHLNEYLKELPVESKVHSVEDILASGLYHEGIKQNLIKASSLSTESDEYFQRLEKRKQVQEKLNSMMDQYEVDVLVYPHQKQLVCKVGSSQLERNGVLASVTGFPSMCIPAGFSSPNKDAPIGVPIGMEILGRPYSEALIIEFAYSLENLSSKRKAPIL